jgi:hypothetical protein
LVEFLMANKSFIKNLLERSVQADEDLKKASKKYPWLDVTMPTAMPVKPTFNTPSVPVESRAMAEMPDLFQSPEDLPPGSPAKLKVLQKQAYAKAPTMMPDRPLKPVYTSRNKEDRQLKEFALPEDELSFLADEVKKDPYIRQNLQGRTVTDIIMNTLPFFALPPGSQVSKEIVLSQLPKALKVSAQVANAIYDPLSAAMKVLSQNTGRAVPEIAKSILSKAKEVNVSEVGAVGKPKLPALPKVPEVAPVAKEPWQETKAQYDKWYQDRFPQEKGAEATHKEIVQQALSEGKPVPEAVLKDYPDLAKNIPVSNIPSAKAVSPETPQGIKPATPAEAVKPSPAAPQQATEAIAQPTANIPPQPPNQPPVQPSQPAKPIKPEPSKADMNRIIAQSTEQVKQDRPGLMTKLAQKIPGIKQLVQFERPGLKMTGNNEKVLTAMVSENAARSEVSTRALGTRSLLIRKLEKAFSKDSLTGGKVDVPFIGTPEQAQNPITGTLKDIADNPDLYTLNNAQKQALADMETRNNDLLKRIKDGYAAEVGQYPVKPGGAFLPNVDIGEDIIESIGRESKSVASGKGKTRIWATARDRMTGETAFTPELNVQKLIEGMDNFKAGAAGGQTAREVLGGKTRLEVIQETHPALAAKMEALRNRLQKLLGYQTDLKSEQSDAINQFLNSPIELNDLDELRLSLDVKLGARRVEAGRTLPDVQKEIDGIRAQIKALKPMWEAANLKPYKFVQEGIYRYFPAEQYNLIVESRKVSNSPLLKFMEKWRAGAFSGDLSPFSVQGSLGVLADPVNSLKFVAGEAKNAIKAKDLINSVKVSALADDIGLDPEGWSRYASLMGRRLAGTPEEFAAGYLSKIPGFDKFTESTYVALTRQSKNMWETTAKHLKQAGMSDTVAEVVAADAVSKIFPLVNPSRLGQSQARNAFVRALPTSYSFIRQPAVLIGDAVKGLGKIAIGQKVSPKESLALKLLTTIAASVAIVSASSAAITAKAKGKSDKEVLQAMLDAVNPDPNNGKFASIIIGDVRIPLGGPYRAIFRAIYPAEVKGIPFPVPFAGLPRFLVNRVNPAIRTQFELLPALRGKETADYSGFKIVKGNFPENILRGLEYELENAVPLSFGSLATGGRQGKEGGDMAQDFVSQFMGTNMVTPTKWQERTLLGDKYAKEQFNLKWADLNNMQKRELERAHPDLIDMEKQAQAELERKGTAQSMEDFVYSKLKEQAVRERNDGLEKAAQSYLDGSITKEDYDKERGRIRPYYSGASTTLWKYRQEVSPEKAEELAERLNETTKPEDRALDEYWTHYDQLLDSAELPVDWDAINAEMDSFLNRYPESVKKYVLASKDDWIKDLPENARKVETERLQGIEDESWWDDYRGSTLSTPSSGSKFKIPSLNSSPRSNSKFKIPSL